MCFGIDRKAERPRRKTAYKVVRLMPSGVVRSTMYNNKVWSCNKEHRIRSNAVTTEFGMGRYANEGIYVYTSLAAAKRNSNYGNRVIMKVEVDPKDWLFSNYAGNVSTYRAVYVPEKQPYMTWYD